MTYTDEFIFVSAVLVAVLVELFAWAWRQR